MGIWLLNLAAGGIMAVLAMGRPDQIAWRYLRLCGVIVLALLAGGMASSMLDVGCGMSDVGKGGAFVAVGGVLTGLGAVSAIGFLIAAPWLGQRRWLHLLLTASASLPALASACLWSRMSMPVDVLSFGAWVSLVAGQLLGGLLIGSVTAAWLLGHAYLTATKMTIAPLRRISRILAAAVALRVAFAAGSLVVAFLLIPQAPGADHLRQSWLPLTMRIGLGLILPAVGAYMVLDCVRLRSTQSATGILYFLSVLVYVGELASHYLLTETGWPT